MNKCPICNGDRNKDMTYVKKLCITHGITGESCNPGGRKLYFGGKSLQLSDQCNTCDENKIREFLTPVVD